MLNRLTDCPAMNWPFAAAITIETCLVYLPALQFDSAAMYSHSLEVIAVNAMDLYGLAAFAVSSFASVVHSKFDALARCLWPLEPTKEIMTKIVSALRYLNRIETICIEF